MGTRRIILKWKGEMHERRKTRTRWMKTFEFRWSNKEKNKNKINPCHSTKLLEVKINKRRT
jgi:hypothetical protein